MFTQDGSVEPATVGRWSETLEELHGRIAHRFARSEARERVKRYLLGLLGRIERKNGWQMAEAMGDPDPQGVQRLLNSFVGQTAPYSPDCLERRTLVQPPSLGASPSKGFNS